MAVLISDNTNPAYDGNWSTVNAWYRVESHHLGPDGYGTYGIISASQERTINVTFANAGNCKGVVLPLKPYSTNITGSYAADTIYVYLLETKSTCTIDISTDYVTKTGHGLSDGDIVILTTTGVLPTGLSANFGRYFVINKTTDTFQLSLTSGGAAINFTGTQSGTHTLWVARIKEEKSHNTLFGTQATGKDGIYFCAIKFTTPYAVDTTASKWRFWIRHATNTTAYGTAIFAGNYPTAISADTICYATWCDTQATFSSGNDCPIIADKVTIDASISIVGVAAAKGDATLGHTKGKWMWVCSNSASQAPADVIKIYWPSSVASAYTLTITGYLLFGSYSGLQIGDSLANPISIAKKATIDFVNFVDGIITRGSGIDSMMHDSYPRTGNANTVTFWLYGEIPTIRKTTVASDAAISQKKIVTTDATGWTTGIIGNTHSDFIGSGGNRFNFHTVSSVSGTEITVAATLQRKIYAGASVYTDQGYGIEITKSSGASQFLNGGFSCSPANLYISGVCFRNTGINPMVFGQGLGITSYNGGQLPETSNYSQLVFEDNLIINTNTYYGWDNAGLFISPKGNIIRRNYFINTKGPTFISPIYQTGWNSGVLSYYDNIHSGGTWALNIAYPGFLSNTSYLPRGVLIYNNILSNMSNTAGAGAISVNGISCKYYNNEFWGLSSGVLDVRDSIRCEVYNNTFNQCSAAFLINNKFSSLNRFYSNTFGGTVANTYDINMLPGGFYDITFEDNAGTTTVDTTYLPQTVEGNSLKIVNKNNVANDDIVYQTYGIFKRCGDGLSDTTVHTSGTGKFSLRFESNSSAARLEWTQVVPTSNIQNKSMVVYVWCKLNSTNYYSGTSQMPRLTVDYDNGTTIYAEAVQTTDWQLLMCPFTPTTTYGAITVTCSTMTDQSTTNAYVYFDDMGVLYPAGHQLNLGGMDDWAKALPVVPSIATNLSAADVWSYPTVGLTATGTTGKKLKDGFTVADSQALL